MTHMDPYNTNQQNQQANDIQQVPYNAADPTHSSHPQGPIYGSTPAPYRPYKKGIGTKGIVAIILSCALLFGGIGFGSAWYLRKPVLQMPKAIFLPMLMFPTSSQIQKLPPTLRRIFPSKWQKKKKVHSPFLRLPRNLPTA